MNYESEKTWEEDTLSFEDTISAYDWKNWRKTQKSTYR